MTASDDPVRPVADPDADRRRDADHRRVRRERSRRRATVRRRLLAGLLIVAAGAAAAGWIGAASGGSPPPRSSSIASARRTVAGATRAPRTPARLHAHPHPPAPGTLAQTDAYPSASSALFKSLMASLWAGIVRDSLPPALTAFFPRGAYLQLKAISSAGSDWSGRLVGDYGRDIAAAHALLGRDGAQARLIGVNVPSSYGHWVPPGVCSNSIGYYELPNARIVYREDGQIRSFGIASMISWRGVWYVVHLGAILRATDSGTVDEPAAGQGTSADSGTC
jgi:hypothetical protein